MKTSIIAPGTAFIVNGDEPRLRQVLANLVNNAITHTPAGTPIRVKIARGSVEPRPADGNGAATDPPGRPATALLLSRDHGPEVLQALRNALTDVDWSMRAAAVHAIAVRNDPALEIDLIPLFEVKQLRPFTRPNGRLRNLLL